MSLSADPQENFGSLLKRSRRAARLTQVQLALRAGYSVVQISKIERGERVPPQATFEHLAAALALREDKRAALEAAYRYSRQPRTPLPSPAQLAGGPDPELPRPPVVRVPELALIYRH